ncbi:hypothetical protein [Pararhizobium haloflavum]|uniref:hypothetical protein n=1 Tax=Pararhizobium haloflavum TaxID=2037914 RepID=UPI0012FFF537|nr:hypothetical protein [Pararhizobium haloflavum]
MSSPFHRAARRAQAAVAKVHGEDIDLIPMTSTDYSTAHDNSRPIQQITAVLMTASESVGLKGQVTGPGSDFQGGARIVTDDPVLWIASETVDALEWRPKRGDIVRATAREGGPRSFTVIAAYPNDNGDMSLFMTRGAATLPPEADPSP